MTVSNPIIPVVKDVIVALKAGIGGIRLVTRDELAFFNELSAAEPSWWPSGRAQPMPVRVIAWSPITGAMEHTADGVRPMTGKGSAKLARADGPDDAAVFILDLHEWIAKNTDANVGPQTRPLILALTGVDALLSVESEVSYLARRALIEACRIARTRMATLLVVGREASLHAELDDDLIVLKHELPTSAETRGIVRAYLETLQDPPPPPEVVDQILEAGQGLTASRTVDATALAIAKARAENRKFNVDDVRAYKEREMAGGALIARTPRRSLDDIVGYGNLKEWLAEMRAAMTPAARARGIARPKGALLAGPPGTGKTRLAEAIATSWRVTWLTLDVSALFQSYIGETEERMRSALEIADRFAPCVLHVDEVDTAFTSRGAADVDGGTSRRIFGTFLRWLADKQSDVFVVMTSNRPHELDAALVRKGRLDELWLVDLPEEKQRLQIWHHYLRRALAPREVDGAFLERLARDSVGFAPSEIEDVVASAVRRAFTQGRDLDVAQDVLAVHAGTTPLSKSMAEAVTSMRAWATQFARPA